MALFIPGTTLAVYTYKEEKAGGGGLISVEDAINTEERNINVYISQSQERLLKSGRMSIKLKHQGSIRMKRK